MDTFSQSWSRRQVLGATVGLGAGFPWVRSVGANPVLGQGDFRYRLVPGWGVLDEHTPVKNCHGVVMDAEGHLILLTDHVANHVIVYDSKGKLVQKWGTEFPGAHGLSLVKEGVREVLYLTCLQTHRVVKCSLDGEKLGEWGCPDDRARYANVKEYRPSWTLHVPGGDFFVLDGYGKDYIHHYDAGGMLKKTFGGADGGIQHWGPHGGCVDLRVADQPRLWVAMSDQQHLLTLSLDGEKLARLDLPGGNPRQIRRQGDYHYVTHLADNWPADRQSRGFVSILNLAGQVVANVGGSAPEYAEDGKLKKMHQVGDVFMHPHDAVVDKDGSLYVAQFASGNTYPLKLERI